MDQINVAEQPSRTVYNYIQWTFQRNVEQQVQQCYSFRFIRVARSGLLGQTAVFSGLSTYTVCSGCNNYHIQHILGLQKRYNAKNNSQRLGKAETFNVCSMWSKYTPLNLS